MLYQIAHQTTYSFSHPVYLKPHLVRLCPRSDRLTQVRDFNLTVLPLPQGRSDSVDLDGNNLIKLWFQEATEQLKIQIQSTVETSCSNPFNYLLEPWTATLPFDYPQSLYQQLKPYLLPYSFAFDSIILQLAQDLLLTSKGNPLEFLFILNQKIYQDCNYIIRDTGAAFPPGITWRERQGSCRDYTVLFMDVCRSIGMASRFVSGYQEGDEDMSARDLHAWVEVYLPGAGWRGYDPTLGLVVSDRHIPLAASAIPQYTAPISGAITPREQGQHVTSEMNAQIFLTAQEHSS